MCFVNVGLNSAKSKPKTEVGTTLIKWIDKTIHVIGVNGLITKNILRKRLM